MAMPEVPICFWLSLAWIAGVSLAYGVWWVRENVRKDRPEEAAPTPPAARGLYTGSTATRTRAEELIKK